MRVFGRIKLIRVTLVTRVLHDIVRRVRFRIRSALMTSVAIKFDLIVTMRCFAWQERSFDNGCGRHQRITEVPNNHHVDP